jgi:hypothetical protein
MAMVDDEDIVATKIDHRGANESDGQSSAFLRQFHCADEG